MISNSGTVVVRLIRNLIITLGFAFSFNVVASEPVVYLDQGWTTQQRQTFYETPQGSYLIPLKWYLALEQTNKDDLFTVQENIKKFNYIIKSKYDGSVANVPLGFAVETVENENDWLGYSCAACHTSEIKFKGKNIRIDGAPALANFASFVEELKNAIVATLQNEEKFNRFASRVIGSYNPAAKQALYDALTEYSIESIAFSERNHTNTKYGYARLDAFGIIMNELFVDDLKVPTNVSEPNAPVSYPFLWNTPSHDWVQWNGGANNPIGRNVGEVLGTFGSVNVVNPATFGETSARGKELIILEKRGSYTRRSVCSFALIKYSG